MNARERRAEVAVKAPQSCFSTDRMDDEFEIDMGPNATGLGWGLLFFKFLFPVILGFIVLVVGFLLLKWFLLFSVALVPVGGGIPQGYQITGPPRLSLVELGPISGTEPG